MRSRMGPAVTRGRPRGSVRASRRARRSHPAATPVMPISRRLVAAPILLAAAGCGGLPVESAGASSRDRASAAVDDWAGRHPDGWRLDLATARPLARPSFAPPCSASPPSGFALVRYETADAEIDLAFRCPIGAGDGAAALQARFAFAVLGRLPHGIAVPGWVFGVLTPSSSIATGVTFADAGGGRVRVRIDTPLFAVRGVDTRPGCTPPADSSMPAACYVSREHAVPLVLTLVAPIPTATLR